MKEKFSFFGPASGIYALFFTFCLYKNGSGITFPFFIAGSLYYFYLCMKKLEISVKKDSLFYMISLQLLGISTCLTADPKILLMNKTAIFFLFLSLMIHQFYADEKWQFFKYLSAILQTAFGSVCMIGYPFSHANEYREENKENGKGFGFYIILGICISIPLLAFVLMLLMSADIVFKEMLEKILSAFSFSDILGIFLMILFAFFASYCILFHLCSKRVKETVADKRTGEPILAITITSILSAIYLMFCGIQIVYLFFGKMQLPEGYTYAQYAREGFFQLLAICVINLVLVLIGLNRFKESKILQIILTVISGCTYIMIASSAFRMILYIRTYYLTFLRVFVLWALAVIFVWLTGILISIYKNKFPLFKYFVISITVFYLALSFSHPDYWIAKGNLSFENYDDYNYLTHWLSADSAPALKELIESNTIHPDFADNLPDMNIRTFNASRQIAKSYLPLSIDK